MIVVCGEALIDLVPAGPAATWRAAYGGGPANTAVALARLGSPVAFAGRLSGDRFGRELREHLRGNGVDLRLAVAAKEPTTLAVVAVDERGGADYQFYVNGTADWQWSPAELPARLPAGTRSLHIGSLASILAPGAAVLRDWLAAHRGDAVVTYDVNVRPSLQPDRDAYRRQVAGWLDVAHIVKASRDDLAWLYPSEDYVRIGRRWLDERDLTLVLVTLGRDGALAITREGAPVTAAGFDVKVVDTVGAGDTFTAGFLHRLDRLQSDALDPTGLADALEFAVAAAALACTRAGAEPPTLAAVEELLRTGTRAQ